MRIAQVAPLFESVPPKLYGGTERVVAYLTEELVAMGHEVTLFASGDSKTDARLISACRESLRLNSACLTPLLPHIVQLEQVYQMEDQFDMIHFHNEALHLPVARRSSTPHLATLHARQDSQELVDLFRTFPDAPVVSISNSQRKPVPHAHFIGTVYHGLPLSLYDFGPEPDDYVLFLGRISPEKRLDRAIQIAKDAGLPIKVAAKVDRADHVYFEKEIKHLLDQPHVEMIGEVGDVQKNQLLQKARALLFPIDWPEPFGLVMIEALACGTPVIAFENGSVPEILEHGVTGFIVHSMEEAVRSLTQVHTLSRARCRQVFEQRFSARTMAEGYVKLYESLIKQKSSWHSARTPYSDHSSNHP